MAWDDPDDPADEPHHVLTETKPGKPQQPSRWSMNEPTDDGAVYRIVTGDPPKHPRRIDRLAAVAHLAHEKGLSTPAIAQQAKIADRLVARDMSVIKRVRMVAALLPQGPMPTSARCSATRTRTA